MATHEIPVDGTEHERTAVCPCQPGRRDRAGGGVTYTHRDRRPAEVLAGQGREDPDCGHVVIDVDGDRQHHDIPDDGAPHAPTTGCGCGPARLEAGDHVVYAHVDQAADDADDDDWEGGPQ